MSEPYYQDERVTLYHGDCLEVLRELADSSVDAVVTDPPYGLSNTDPQHVADTIVRWVNGDREYLPPVKGGFMGQEWDSFVPPVAVWDECLRVLKPGGHLLAFAGPRTMDLMGLGIRLAGFDIRDSIAWLYGSGFPKSLDVSKAIDKARKDDPDWRVVGQWLKGHREAVGYTTRAEFAPLILDGHKNLASAAANLSNWENGLSFPTWDWWLSLKALLSLPDDMDAEVWRLNGRKGKPGDNFEAREVLSERVSVVEGGSGGWSDMVASGRFKPGEKIIRETAPATPDAERWQGWGTALKPAFEPVVVARKPLTGTVAANVLQHGTGALNIDACRVPGAEPTERGNRRNSSADPDGLGGGTFGIRARSVDEKERHAGRWPTNVVLDDSQAAELDQQSGESTSKAGGRTTKALGVMNDDGWEAKDLPRTGHEDQGGASRFFYTAKADSNERPRINGVAHPTVKPLDLMSWLVRLVTPPGGTVLEPFAGSGTTVEACIIEGFRCIAIEREADYLPLITQRIHRRLDPLEAVRQAGGDLGLFDFGEPS